MKDIALSAYGDLSSRSSPVNRMMAEVAADFRDGYDINLGVGYVNEATIPRERIHDAIGRVLADPKTYRLALNYGGPQGSQNLIDALVRYHARNGIGELTEEVLAKNEIIIGPSGATSLLEGVAHVLSPGIVITSDPMYYIYCNFLERAGFEVLAVPEDEHGIDTAVFEEKLRILGERRQAIRFVYVVTINNPTCSILSNERRQELVAITTRLSRDLGRKVPLVLDKAYEGLVHDPTVPPLKSGLLCDELGIVYEIGTLSKILAPALRVGYMIGRAGPFLRAMIQHTSDIGFSAPLVTQEAAAYLLDHYVSEQVASVNEGYRIKAQHVRRCIDADLARFFERYSGGRAGFYYYLTFKTLDTQEGSPFFTYLARRTGDPEIDGPEGSPLPRVAYVPGQYCVHPAGDLVEVANRQLRLSYGFEEIDRIEQAVGYMKEAAGYALARV